MLNKITTAAAIIALATAGVANARSYETVSFNLGGELSINKPAFAKTNDQTDQEVVKALKKNKAGANIFAGVRFNQYFGAELGFGAIAKTKSTVDGIAISNKATNVYVDALGYLPVAAKVDLIGAVGVGKFSNKVTQTDEDGKSKDKFSKTGARVGVGAQYYFTDNVSARAMVRYQQANKDFQKSNTSLALGVAYTF